MDPKESEVTVGAPGVPRVRGYPGGRKYHGGQSRRIVDKTKFYLLYERTGVKGEKFFGDMRTINKLDSNRTFNGKSLLLVSYGWTGDGRDIVP